MLNNNSARCSIQSGSLSGSTPWRAVPRFDFLGGGEGGKAELSGLRTEGRVSLAGSLRERIHGTQGDRSWDAEKSLVRSRAMESPHHWPRMDPPRRSAGLDGSLFCTDRHGESVRWRHTAETLSQ